MINESDFSERLQKVIDYYGLTASAFADELGVQRSSISHLLSQRNKPSLDFILKMEESFPELDLHWLTKGQGEFPPTAQGLTSVSNKSKDLFSDLESESTEKTSASEKSSDITTSTNMEGERKIEKIVFFYTDGTFKIYEN